jgi:hypothetical protein
MMYLHCFLICIYWVFMAFMAYRQYIGMKITNKKEDQYLS